MGVVAPGEKKKKIYIYTHAIYPRNTPMQTAYIPKPIYDTAETDAIS